MLFIVLSEANRYFVCNSKTIRPNPHQCLVIRDAHLDYFLSGDKLQDNGSTRGLQSAFKLRGTADGKPMHFSNAYTRRSLAIGLATDGYA